MSGWPIVPGIADLADQFDVFLIDQFGTLHDGSALYPGVTESLRRLRTAGARIVLLSNSGKRADHNAARLTRLGIPPDAYELFVTSGEVAWQLLHDGLVPAARGATRCLLLERDDDATILDGLGLTRADAVAAQLVIIAGSQGDRLTLDDYAARLAPAARAGVPALCLNPDRIMLTSTGPAFGAGRIAELYQSMGGPVHWIGKPHPQVYDIALQRLGIEDRSRVVGIGDSIEHDIAGALGAGCSGWLVRTGIVADADDAALEAECRRVGASPGGILARF